MRRLKRCALPAGIVGAIAALAIATVPAAVADPAAGAFVIGDGNAAPGAAVTFWGAQWWTDGTLTGGTAPPSFKGYAVSFDATTCTFTSRPGNSSSPPDGPLPGTITVCSSRAR